MLEKCVWLNVKTPNLIWPYFANMRAEIGTGSSEVCKQLVMRDLSFEVKLHIKNKDSNETKEARFEFMFDLIRTPDRKKRLLFDQFHSLKYPDNGFIMRDSLNPSYAQPYEWTGDHMFTNYVQLHQRLTEYGGYFVETLTDPFTCFDASNYGALLLLDPEDFFSRHEIQKLRQDIETNNLSLIVLADWYSDSIMKQSSISFNKASQEKVKPVMAGSNVRSLNALLDTYHISFGDQKVMSGDFVLDKR